MDTAVVTARSYATGPAHGPPSNRGRVELLLDPLACHLHGQSLPLPVEVVAFAWDGSILRPMAPPAQPVDFSSEPSRLAPLGHPRPWHPKARPAFPLLCIRWTIMVPGRVTTKLPGRLIPLWGPPLLYSLVFTRLSVGVPDGRRELGSGGGTMGLKGWCPGASVRARPVDAAPTAPAPAAAVWRLSGHAPVPPAAPAASAHAGLRAADGGL
jgi:hypothetical protein